MPACNPRGANANLRASNPTLTKARSSTGKESRTIRCRREPAARKRKTRARRGRDPKLRQLTFEDGRWGGPRKGAGAKPRPGAGVPHDARERFGKLPVHVTLRLLPDLMGLRHRAEVKVVRRGLAAGREGRGFRLVHYTILWDHLHLIVEAGDEVSLAAGMKGLCVRLARGLNRHWGRTGRVFADRYHAHVLRTPRATRNALRYVLCNARKHRVHASPGPDPLSSSRAFRHWIDVDPRAASGDACVVDATFWLLTTGWLRHQQPFATSEVPPHTTSPRAFSAQRRAERRLRTHRSACRRSA